MHAGPRDRPRHRQQPQAPRKDALSPGAALRGHSVHGAVTLSTGRVWASPQTPSWADICEVPPPSLCSLCLSPRVGTWGAEGTPATEPCTPSDPAASRFLSGVGGEGRGLAAHLRAGRQAPAQLLLHLRDPGEQLPSQGEPGGHTESPGLERRQPEPQRAPCPPQQHPRPRQGPLCVSASDRWGRPSHGWASTPPAQARARDQAGWRAS